MKPALPLIALSALFLTACPKTPSGREAAPASDPPRRNASESLGLVSADPDSYSAPPEASQPSPPAATPENPAPITRTLTNRDGRTVEAVLLSRTATTVKIRRKVDSAEFTIPLDRLSDADQTFIKGSSLPLIPGR